MKKTDIDKSIECFLGGNVGKFGKYISVPNALVYRTIITSQYGKNIKTEQNVIALRLPSGEVIGNSSILPLIGRSVSYGNERNNTGETEVQRKLSEKIPMIPFSVFQESGLSLSKMQIIERGPSEQITRLVDNPDWSYRSKDNVPKQIPATLHYTGASVFKVEDSYFLFDIDRREVEHMIFNPFLAKLPRAVTSIKDAYESLKPSEVIQAENEGKKVLRQGEWFFIQDDIDPAMQGIAVTGSVDNPEVETYRHKTYELQAGSNRPNFAQFGFTLNNIHYVSGNVVHSGREHAPLKLGSKFWRVIPNTATESFTITGNID